MMDASATTLQSRASTAGIWLRSREWDLKFVTLSVLLVTIPYLVYLGLSRLPAVIGPAANALNTTTDDLSRNAVNALVALFVGIPHTFATFSRTRFDRDYVSKHRAMIRLSIIPPIVVIVLALVHLPLLLTLFFFWASLHTMHQIIFVTDLYNHRHSTVSSRFSRLSDYALILTALYPLAAWKIVGRDFVIGLNDISGVVHGIASSIGIAIGPWVGWLASGLFSVALATWIVKSVIEWRQGALNGPKTLFIAMWTVAAFSIPALPNLDSAFQGLNLWHSSQYLAMTWMLNNIRKERGELDDKPFLKRLSEDGSARRYYLFNMGLTVANIVVSIIIFVILFNLTGRGFDYALDRAYYIGILSFLWIHYFHDHFLFVEPGVIDYQPELATT